MLVCEKSSVICVRFRGSRGFLVREWCVFVRNEHSKEDYVVIDVWEGGDARGRGLGDGESEGG